ncbi:MAG: hypothetical protein GY810_30445 [Aureispira sp.]|nr:hypothetical protein [Aureispira sp.]
MSKGNLLDYSSLKRVLLILVCLSSVQLMSGQYIKSNSPYSRYGLGDLHSLNFAGTSSMAGGMGATYRSYWETNLTNPASLSKLRFTSFEVGLFYKHSELSERNTGLKAKSDDGNLANLSLAFPITRSWEIMRDTLRRGVPVQWGMAFSLTPFSTTSYDVSVSRGLAGIDTVNYNYLGTGNLYRVNWGNGLGYKGFSLGFNLGMVFGKNTYISNISFQDSSYNYGFDESLREERNTSGMVWDIGAQYEFVFKPKGASEADSDVDLKMIVGAYAGGSAFFNTNSKQVYLRYGKSSLTHSTDTIRNTADVKGQMNLPLKIGGGVSFGKEFGWLVGVNYEHQLWSLFRENGAANPNLTDGFNISAGVQWIPDITDFTSYFNRIRYRAGFQYGADPRQLTGADGNSKYQLYTYGGSVGFGLPIRPPKSKSMLGFLNLGLDIGYIGHPELINDFYVKVNLGFTLSDKNWFVRPKFR